LCHLADSRKSCRYSNYDLPLHFEHFLLRQSLSQTHSYSTLAIYLKLFAKFARLIF